METEPTPAHEPGARSTRPLSLGRRLFFGAPGFAGASLAIPIGVLMPRFSSDVVLVPLGAIAVAAALARSLDAITDPLMGWLSDRTRSRFGRRKPYIAGGLLPMALCFLALFAPPAAGRGVTDPLTGAPLAPEAEGTVPEADGWFLDHFSPRELRRLDGNCGSGRGLVRAVGAALALSLAGFVALSGLALGAARDTADPAPLTTVFAVVGAGLSLTAALFHGARLGAARRYAQRPVAGETLRAHVEALDP